MKRLLSLALAASLCACGPRVTLPPPASASPPIAAPAPAPAPSPSVGAALAAKLAMAGPTIAALQERYDWAWPFVERLLKYLPPARAAQLQLAGSIVRQALVAARTATSLADQHAAIEKAKAALAPIAVTSGDDAPS